MEPKVEDALPNAQLGNRALALSAHWHYGLAMPAGQIADLLNDHLRTAVSRGGLFGMWKRLADCLQPWCEQLIDEMLESGCLAMRFDCTIGRDTIPRCFNRASIGSTND